MNRFGYGVLIFFISIMLFSLMEYEVYVSLPVCCCVCFVLRKMLGNIRSLVNAFWLDQDTIVTGQFLPGDKRAEARAAAKMRARTDARLRGESVESAERGVTEVGHMLTGRYDADDSSVGSSGCSWAELAAAFSDRCCSWPGHSTTSSLHAG